MNSCQTIDRRLKNYRKVMGSSASIAAPEFYS